MATMNRLMMPATSRAEPVDVVMYSSANSDRVTVSRLASKMIKITYAIFNWTGAYRALRSLIATSDECAEAFLVKGLDTWQEEGRISASEADETRQYLAGREVHDGLRHLGAHLAITAVFRFPFGSILRPMWTLGFFIRELSLRVRPGTPDRRRSLMMHGPHVMLLSIIPGFGGMAYLVSGPLRKPILLRLMLDRVARKLRLGTRFAPRLLGAVEDTEPSDIAVTETPATHPVRPIRVVVPELPTVFRPSRTVTFSGNSQLVGQT